MQINITLQQGNIELVETWESTQYHCPKCGFETIWKSNGTCFCSHCLFEFGLVPLKKYQIELKYQRARLLSE